MAIIGAIMLSRRTASLLLLLTLSACGFHPLYGDSAAPAQAQLAGVGIDNIEGRDGQKLRLLLSDRFYSAAHQDSTIRYRLGVSYTTNREELGIRSDDVATRARLSLIGSFTLTPVDGGAPFKSSERAFVSYNILTDPYATTAAEDNATERGLTQLADAITSRVALYLAGNPGLNK